MNLVLDYIDRLVIDLFVADLFQFAVVPGNPRFTICLQVDYV